MSFHLHPNTQLLIGPPGTGKTTALLNRVNMYLEEGVSPRDIAFVTFTRKGAQEASERALERFTDLSPDDFIGFRTLHSLAYWWLGINSKQVFRQKHAVELGRKLGVFIGGLSIHQDSLEPVSQQGEGTQMMFVDNMSRVCMEPLETTWHRMHSLDYDVPWVKQKWFSDQFHAYVKGHGLIDFTMMLQNFLGDDANAFPFKVVIVDEAQDLMRIQWEMVKKIAQNAHTVIVAGDDDQAIYQWSGADVDRFLELEYTEKIVLDHSYRLPSTIFDVANQISGTISNRYDKVWAPKNEVGLVRQVYHLDDVPLGAGEWLILVRNNCIADKVTEYLSAHALNYWSKSNAPYDKDLLLDIRYWERLRQGQDIPVRMARSIYERMRVGTGYKRGNKLLEQFETKDRVTIELLQEQGGLRTTEIWHKAFEGVPLEQREYLVTLLRQGETLDKPRIIVSTIHSAKGGEADNVLLLQDITPRTAKAVDQRADEEARVFYVGVTRARKRLYLMQAGWYEHTYHIQLD